MRRSALITMAVCMAAIACSKPSSDGPLGGDDVPVFDVGRHDLAPRPETGSEPRPDQGDVEDAAAVPTLESELVTDLGGLADEPDEVLIYDADGYLILLADRNVLAWVPKDGSFSEVVMGRWPDSADVPEPGPPSLDLEVGEERVWFTAQTDAGVSGLVGMEHQLGAPFPLFGQPIVIIDVGPRTEARGLAQIGAQFVAGFDRSDGVDQPTVVLLAEGLDPTFVDAPGALVFDDIGRRTDEALLWTEDADGVALNSFDPRAEQFVELTRLTERPLATTVTGETVVFIAGDGSVHAVSDGEPQTIVGEATTDESPLLGADTGTVAWSNGEWLEIRTEDARYRVSAPGAQSVVADPAAIYWSGGSNGVFRVDIPE